MNEAKSYTVHILDEQYSIHTDEPKNHMVGVAERLDALMNEIQLTNAYIEPKNVAVLASLRLMSQLVYLENQLHDLLQKEQELSAVIENVCR